MNHRRGQFFLIGAMKAGTSTLYKYLAAHPDIYGTPRKEPRFFAIPQPSAAETRAYAALYEGRTSEPWAFEASTAYTKYPMLPGVPERIHAAHPDALLIYMVRDPIERICSAYLHNRAEGREQRPFEEAVFAGSQEYLNVSKYHMQIERYLQLFPRERLLVLLFEDFVADPDGALDQIARFLRLERGFKEVGAARRYNETAKKRAPHAVFRLMRAAPAYRRLPARVKLWMSEQFTDPLPTKRGILDEATRRRLVDALELDVAQLRKFLQRDLTGWNVPSR